MARPTVPTYTSEVIGPGDIGETFTSLRLHGFEIGEAQVRPPWGVRRPSGFWDVHFYLLKGAPCRFIWNDRQSIDIDQLTVCLVNDRRSHAFQDALNSPIMEVAQPLLPGTPPSLRIKSYGGTEGDATSSFYIGGALEQAPGLPDLPPLILLRFAVAPAWLASSVRLIRQEMRQPRVDFASVSRLCEFLLLKTIRCHLGDGAEPEGASRRSGSLDGRVRRARSLIDSAPAKPWTLTTLAETIGMSRSRLTAHWQSEMGLSIFDYISQRRLETAAHMLCESNLDIGTIAHRVGYHSHAAFSTAFKRLFGRSPAAYRVEIPDPDNKTRRLSVDRPLPR